MKTAFPNKPVDVQVDVQEALTSYTAAIQTINTRPIARLLRPADGRAAIAAALNTVPALCCEVHRLRTLLGLARLDHANLVAALRAALTADHEGETDPLWYLRDELADRDQLPHTCSGPEGAAW